jgi:hypothetical protein
MICGVTLACGLALSASGDSPAAAVKAVTHDLEKLKAQGYVMQQVQDAATERTFPKYAFFGVYFRQYPVARLTPDGMSNANLYAVGPDGKAALIKESLKLQEFFRKTLGPVVADGAAKDAAHAYVRLSEELHQDGFYKFTLQDDSTKVEAGKDGKTAHARAVVMAGGNGELSASLLFDQAGKLRTVTENVKLRPGPRPICQATKLLDADLIVRKMAEQDLLIMGRAARYYLDEQRAIAGSDLRRAIDQMWDRIVADDP